MDKSIGDGIIPGTEERKDVKEETKPNESLLMTPVTSIFTPVKHVE